MKGLIQAANDVQFVYEDIVANQGAELVSGKNPRILSTPFGFSVNPYISGVVLFGQDYAGVSLYDRRDNSAGLDIHVDNLATIIEQMTEKKNYRKKQSLLVEIFQEVRLLENIFSIKEFLL